MRNFGMYRFRRKAFNTSLCVLLAYFAFSLYLHHLTLPSLPSLPQIITLGLTASSVCNSTDVLEQTPVLLGPPTKRFRDNLRKDTAYITTWSNAGFTNQFMTYVNMIYLSTISERVPILAPFAPDHHVSASAGIVPFGDLFDLDHLRKVLRTPIIEWRDVKALPSRYSEDPYHTSPIDDLGCWTTRKENEREPIRAENVIHHLGVDVSYTRVPSQTRLRPSNQDEPHVVFSQLAATIFPYNPIIDSSTLPSFAPAVSGHHLPPDTHLACFDTLYYATSGADVFEWRFSWSPVWLKIGKHIRFTSTMSGLGRRYLKSAFGLPHTDTPIPPFIAVHIRRGDFARLCSDVSNKSCLPPLARYKKMVEEVRQELMVKRNMTISNVLVTSDEEDPSFWHEVNEEGWSFIDHVQEETAQRMGEWFTPVVDVVVQSFAVGFVGTEDSTFSLVSSRRVEDWNDGFTRSVDVREGYQ